MIDCPRCGEGTRWNNDWDLEDADDNPCIVSLYTCDDCNIDIEITQRIGEGIEE